MADEQNIRIEMTNKQRNLLMSSDEDFENPELLTKISDSEKKGSRYEVDLTPDELDDLCYLVGELADNEENEKRQEELDELYEMLAAHLEEYQTEEDDDDETEEEEDEDEEEEGMEWDNEEWDDEEEEEEDEEM